MATDADRQRLRELRASWVEVLTIPGRAQDQALFNPDLAMEGPLPPAGAYRCRFIKLGSAVRYAARDWGRCRLQGDELVRLDGPQRPIGTLYPDGPSRGIFLGTLHLAEERRPLPYGRDARRDMIGAVERIGPARWRIALPRPGFESTLDLFELVPA
jgi:hypothetical protein